jgi:inner membrane transporter RhtA
VTIEFVGPLAVAVFASRRALDLLWVLRAGADRAHRAVAPRGTDERGSARRALRTDRRRLLGGVHRDRRAAVAPSRRRGAVSAGMLVATSIILPIALDGRGLAHLPPGLALGAAALLSSALPYALEMTALRALPTRTFSILMSLESRGRGAVRAILPRRGPWPRQSCDDFS